jgi:hypothetical protein
VEHAGEVPVPGYREIGWRGIEREDGGRFEGIGDGFEVWGIGGAGRDGGGAVDGEGEDGQAVVVRVLADEVDAAGGAGDERRFDAETVTKGGAGRIDGIHGGIIPA